MKVLGQIQLNLGYLNLRFNSMDECLESMAAQLTSVDYKLDLGANFDEPPTCPSPSQSSEATHVPPHA